MNTVLISGASGGIGQATAKLFAQKGYNVAVHYFSNREAAEQLAREIGGIAVYADVTNESEVKAMFDEVHKQFGKIDVLVNNAGIALKQMVCDTTLEQWRKIIDTNLTGAFLLSKCALSDMMYSSGKIINVSSVYGICGGSCESAYSAAKAGVIGLTKAMAKEYTNININCVCPGAVDTKMNDNLSSEEKELVKNEIPLGRFAKPEEIASTICFLASEEANYITGEVISVNGGMDI